jgi:hypothetical protein
VVDLSLLGAWPAGGSGAGAAAAALPGLDVVSATPNNDAAVALEAAFRDVLSALEGSEVDAVVLSAAPPVPAVADAVSAPATPHLFIASPQAAAPAAVSAPVVAGEFHGADGTAVLTTVTRDPRDRTEPSVSFAKRSTDPSEDEPPAFLPWTAFVVAPLPQPAAVDRLLGADTSTVAANDHGFDGRPEDGLTRTRTP